MKHLKKFKLFEGSLNDLDIEVTDAGPNGGDGGVQIDDVTLCVNDSETYDFELATTISNDSYMTYKGGDNGEFVSHFGLVVDEMMKSEYEDEKPSQSYLELKSFMAQLAYDHDVEGSETDIDGFNIKVESYSHKGGYEFGYLCVRIGEDEFWLNMKQDATGNGYSLESEVTYASDEDEEAGKRNGLELESDEAQDFFFSEYDRICNES